MKNRLLRDLYLNSITLFSRAFNKWMSMRLTLCNFGIFPSKSKSVLTRGGYFTWEIKMRLVMAKEAFNRKISLLASKLNIELVKKLLGFTFGALDYIAQRPGHKEN